MSEIIYNGEKLFILFIFPVVGLLLEYTFSKRVILTILTISLILFSPFFFDYSYIIPSTLQVVAIIGLACLYAIYSMEINNKKSKVSSALIFSGISFAFLGFAYFIDSFAGSQTVLKTWNTSKYKIEYIEDQGFASRPLMKYELNKYGSIPILIKYIDSQAENDSIKSCEIFF